MSDKLRCEIVQDLLPSYVDGLTKMCIRDRVNTALMLTHVQLWWHLTNSLQILPWVFIRPLKPKSIDVYKRQV